MYGFGLLVLVTDRSAVGLAGFVSVDALLISVGSFVPLGGVTVALLTSVPVVPLGTVPVRVKVALAPATRLTAVPMSPVPLPAAQLFGALTLQVQVKPAALRAAGSGSET